MLATAIENRSYMLTDYSEDDCAELMVWIDSRFQSAEPLSKFLANLFTEWMLVCNWILAGRPPVG